MDYIFDLKKLLASMTIIIVLVTPVHSSQPCDAKCPAYRLDSVGLPIPSTAYWWPGFEIGQFSFRVQDQWLDYSLTKDFRNQWHEVQVYHHNHTDDGTPSGSYVLSIPSLNQKQKITCQDLECVSVDIITLKSAWALECEGVPCECPRFMGFCAVTNGSETVINDECKEVSLSSLSVPLDRRSKVFWLPKDTGPQLTLEFGDVAKVLRIHYDCVDTWVEIEINAYFVKEGPNESTHHVCYISIESWEFRENCSGAPILSFSSKKAEVFALSCQEEPRGELGRGVSTSVIVAAAIAGLFIVIFVIRKMPCRKRPRSPATGE